MKKYFINITFILLLVSFFNSTIFSEPEFYSTQNKFIKTNWNTENGLPQNTVTSIIQTKDGYLWIATTGGLTRFDGVKFTLFNSANTKVLKDNRFVSLYEDFEGILWITAEFGNIYYYLNGKFYLFINDESSGKNFFLKRKNNGNLLISDFKYIKEYSFSFLNRFPQLLRSTIKSKREIDFIVNRFTFEDSIFWYISYDRKLIGLDLKTSEKKNSEKIFKNEDLFQVLRNPQKSKGMWVISKNSIGILKKDKYEIIYSFDGNEIFKDIATFIDSQNTLWCMTNKFIYKIVNEKVEKFPLSQLQNNTFRSLTIDNEGNIWGGSEKDGIYRFKTNRVRTYGRIVDKELLGTGAVIEDNDGNIWLGTEGLIRIKHNIQNLEWDRKRKSGKEIVFTINKDNFGNLWFGTNYGLYNFTNKKPTFFDDPTLGRTESYVTSLFFDNNNELWIGRTGGLQLFKDGIFTTYTEKDGLVNNRVNRILQAKNLDLLIGTSGGISRLQNGNFINFTTKNGLSNNNVRDIFEDVDGTLWIGTYGGGINRYRDGKFVSITSNNGLPEDFASCLLLDDNDNFWVLGNNGIYTVSRKSLNNFADGKIKKVISTVHDTKDGLISPEGNGLTQYSGWKANDGTLWFTMIKGAVAINPNEKHTIISNVLIENVIHNSVERDTSKTLKFQYDENDFEINYTALSLTNPEEIQFRYKLEGFDKDWHYVGNRRTAYFTYLPAGKYTFKVEAMSSNGIWVTNYKSIDIIVQKPFWQTWWFYLLIIFSVILTIILLYQLRLLSIKKQKEKQKNFSKALINAHETERNRIASDLHDGLGQNLLIIKNWALIAKKNLDNPQKAQKHLDEISDFAGTALEETRSIAKDLMPLHMKRFGLTQTIKDMLNRVDQTLDISVFFEIENIDYIFSKKDELSIYRIVQECLNNVVKHSDAKEVFVSIDITNNFVKIIIEDDGNGFNFQEHIKSNKHETGFGLNNIIERVNFLNGTINIDSDLKIGTKVFISIGITK